MPYSNYKELNEELFKVNNLSILLDFDGTLISTNIFFEKFNFYFKILDNFYSILKKFLNYEILEKILNINSLIFSKIVSNKYLNNPQSTKEIAKTIYLLKKLKDLNTNIYILSKSKTAICLDPFKKFLKEYKISYFWTLEKERYLKLISLKNDKCIFISDNEDDEKNSQNLNNIIFFKVREPRETYYILKKIIEIEKYGKNFK